MLFPDDFEHLATLSEHVRQWLLKWVHRRWR
jgi:hypothetical protein